MSRPDPDLPLVFRRGEASAAGLSDDQISRRARSGSWTRLRRGWFSPVSGLDERRRWHAEFVATVAEHRASLVLSHAHAARAWRWPAPLGGWGPMSFTVSEGSTRAGNVRILVAPLDADEYVGAGRLLVTSPARTVVDCARTLPPRDALAIADAALASGRVTPASLALAVARVKGWPGAPGARRVLALADGRRESPLESWSAWTFDEQGLPAPQWQVEITDATGLPIGRGDCWWREGLIGEADGRAKYRTRVLERGLASVEGYEAVLHAERIREMQLRRTGALVVRWEARDVLVPVRAVALAGYITTQLSAADALPFEGSVRLA
jgi:Transcriptional regulator, AbiEi antitoxin